MRDEGPSILELESSSSGDPRRMLRKIERAAAVATAILIWRRYGMRSSLRYLGGLRLAWTVQRASLSAMIGKTGSQPASLADVLTLSRAAAGSMLAGLVVSGSRDRVGMVGRMGWSIILLGATATDWLDGPLARRDGATPIGSALDIESDSWLTLWSAASAVAWGGLPRWCLLPPILRYLDPLIDCRRGRLPRGGGPWWSRLTGSSQMVLFLTALIPRDWRGRQRVLAALALPVSSGQCLVLIVLLARKVRGLP